MAGQLPEWGPPDPVRRRLSSNGKAT